MNSPKIYIKDPTILTRTDFDMLLMSKYDIFYRRIVEFVLEDYEGNQEDDLLAVIIDDEGNEFAMPVSYTHLTLPTILLV